VHLRCRRPTYWFGSNLQKLTGLFLELDRNSLCSGSLLRRKSRSIPLGVPNKGLSSGLFDACLEQSRMLGVRLSCESLDVAGADIVMQSSGFFISRRIHKMKSPPRGKAHPARENPS
jgi:hypothetical protein